MTQRPVTLGEEIRDSEAELGRGWRIELAEQQCGTKRGTMMCTVPLHHQTNLPLGTNRREFDWAVSIPSEALKKGSERELSILAKVEFCVVVCIVCIKRISAARVCGTD